MLPHLRAMAFIGFSLVCFWPDIGHGAKWSIHEDPIHFVDRGEGLETNLLHLERIVGSKTFLGPEERPWSGHYWPYSLGGLGHRYGQRFMGRNWEDFYHEFVIHTPPLVLINRGPVYAAQLSPTEKYDLLINGKNGPFPLTKYAWDSSQREFQRSGGHLTGWEGHCNGLAPASLMFPRPLNKLVLSSPDGVLVTFYPHDLKALATLFWSQLPFEAQFLGQRCYDRVAQKDEKGRIKKEECRDVNPGAWHLVVLNQIGLGDHQGRKKSFIMDIDYQEEVWNYTVIGFDIRYYNVQTQRYFPQMFIGAEKNTVNLDLFTDIQFWPQDPFRRYRASGTKYVVGVRMDVTYGLNTPPLPSETDDPTFDRTHVKTFNYHLELDDEFNIVGGEWFWPEHPDFLWKLPKHLKNRSIRENVLSSWSLPQSLPRDWIKEANSKAQRGLPLGRIIEELIFAARE